MGAKDNNKGFSLLELLVAVAILAVVVTPFLMAFLTTTRINASTKNQQRARFAATNVMEDIRSVNAEDIVAVTKDERKLLDDGTYLYKQGSSATFDGKDVTVGEVRVEKVEDKVYKYITTEMSDGVPYTVEAELNANPEDNKATIHNLDDMVNIYAMKKSTDAFYQLDAITDFGKIEELAEKRLNSRDDETLQQIYNSVNREIRIDVVENKNNSNNVDVVVNVDYTVPYGAEITDAHTPRNQVIYSKSKDKLKNIYLFYNPLYNGTSRQARETITVVNQALEGCNVYLIRQDWPSDNPEDPAYSEEYKSFPFFKYNKGGETATNKERNQNYLVNVRLQETNRDKESFYKEDGTLDVLTYIRTNIDEVSIKDDGEYTKPKHLNLSYSYTGDNGYAADHDPPKAIEIMGLNSLVGYEKNDRVYKVTVNAYVEGDDNGRYGKYAMEATTE